MKKSTKKVLASIIIIAIFGMSSIAYVTLGIFGVQPQQTKLLKSNVIDEPVSQDTENFYIQNQYTFLNFYYTQPDALYDYVSSLPDMMTLPTGEVQLFVVRAQANETSALVANLKGGVDVTDLSQQGIFNALCENLMFTPTDCLLSGIQQPVVNNSSNQTDNSTQQNITLPNVTGIVP